MPNKNIFDTFDRGPAQIDTLPTLDLQQLRHFARDIIAPLIEAHGEEAFRPEIARLLYEAGHLTPAFPNSNSGNGHSLIDAIWVVRELGYVSGGVGTTYVGNILGQTPIALYANPSLRNRLIGKCRDSYCLWSGAMTEEDAGSDIRRVVTHARSVDGGYLLNGEKNYITNGNHATDLTVYAQLDAGAGSTNVSCFYLPGDAPGLSRGEPYKTVGLNNSDTSRLIFKNVFVPAEALIGKPGDGLMILAKCLERSKTLLAANAVGMAQRAFSSAVDHMRSFCRGGKPMIDQPVLRHQLARMHCELEASWLMVCKAASAWDAGKSADLESAEAKLFAADRAFAVASECVELMGGRGYTMPDGPGRQMRDIKGMEILEGPSLVQEILIMRSLFPPSGARTSVIAEQAQSSKEAA